jgi:hypothetical protein
VHTKSHLAAPPPQADAELSDALLGTDVTKMQNMLRKARAQQPGWATGPAPRQAVASLASVAPPAPSWPLTLSPR